MARISSLQSDLDLEAMVTNMQRQMAAYERELHRLRMEQGVRGINHGIGGPIIHESPSQEEEAKVRRLMMIIRTDILTSVMSSGTLPRTSTELIDRALIAKYEMDSFHEEQTRPFKMRKKEGVRYQSNFPSRHKSRNKYLRKRNSDSRKQSQHDFGKVQTREQSTGPSTPACLTCGRTHPGECRLGTKGCYRCGKPGHVARECHYLARSPTIPTQPKAPVPYHDAIRAVLNDLRSLREASRDIRSRIELADTIHPDSEASSSKPAED